jgi:hypothetical protein
MSSPPVGDLLRRRRAGRAVLFIPRLVLRLLRNLADNPNAKGWEDMLKSFCTTLTVVLLAVGSAARAASPLRADEQEATEAENREAREVVIQFTKRFAETRDLTNAVNELYVSDFIERYKKSRAKDADPSLSSKSSERYFAPGLDYDTRLLAEAGAEDWRRFYIAANNFLLVGLVAFMKQARDDGEAPNVKPTDVYPPSVIEMLDKNPNLSNFIVRKSQPRPVGTLGEMRSATNTLERAVAIMRQAQPGKPFSADDKDWAEATKLMREDKLFKPDVEVTDEEFFGFPKGTRIIIVKTPLGLRLMLARDNNRLKIFWTEIIAD